MHADATRGGPIGGPLGRALARAYGWEIARRNRRFDTGIGVTRLDRPVISVGNLSVGGTGKTPMVRWVVEQLRSAGRRPCVAMRGYGRKRGGESDEEGEYRRALPGVPIVAQPDRAAGLRAFFASEEGRQVDVVVLDDGFQHRRLARDVDIVLVDASRSPFGDRLLPSGWLREGVESLERASAVVVTHAEMVEAAALEELAGQIARAFAGPVAVTAHEWAGLAVADGGGERVEDVDWLKGKRVVAVCAIGNPAGFVAACRERTAEVKPVVLRDHAEYSPRVLARVFEEAEGADAIVTTEKDWTKLRHVPREQWPAPVARAQVRMGFRRGEEELRGVVLKVRG